MTDLGTLGTGNTAVAWAINENGQVVGHSALSTSELSFEDPAFLWQHRTMVDLGDPFRTEESSARDVTSTGLMAGKGLDGDGLSHAVLWSLSKKTHEGSYQSRSDSISALEMAHDKTAPGTAPGRFFVRLSFAAPLPPAPPSTPRQLTNLPR
jgi:probable HAF family extracellular repeat protein